jgi:hypothetical protein
MEKSLSPNVVSSTPHSSTSTALSKDDKEKEVDQICQWIRELGEHDKRENALLQISKRRETVEDLAVWLWYSYGTVRFPLFDCWQIVILLFQLKCASPRDNQHIPIHFATVINCCSVQPGLQCAGFDAVHCLSQRHAQTVLGRYLFF